MEEGIHFFDEGKTMSELTHDVLWRRLKYMLSPQWDFYYTLRGRFENAVVLEVGFGTGIGVLQYAPFAAHVDAIELDAGAVHFAESTFPLTNVSWIKQDLLEFENRSYAYDYVIMIEVLEHIRDYASALSKIRSLLKPGGQFIMSARNVNADLRRWKDLHEREWKSQKLVHELGNCFNSVELFDYTLRNEQDVDTSLTPLFAVCK
jgi:2-polyprenyl-3-methyl-5-hydroxy-6-metoxy-1,4-benzoquinol methylase